jgi:diguanylate cyclase (GGDEF)-like protein
MKIRKRDRIQWKLLIPTCVAFLTATILINMMVLSDTEIAISNVLEELRLSVVNLVETELDKHLTQAIILNETHKNMLEGGYLNTQEATNRERYFSSMIQSSPDVVMTYFGLESGEFYGARRVLDQTIEVVKNNEVTQGNSEYYSIKEDGSADTLMQVFENYDPRKRPWYQAAIEKKGRTFSGIYSHFIFKEPTITASLPIYEEDVLVGVFGVDFLMTWLGETLRNLPIGEHGQIFIVDENMQLIASTTEEELFQIVDNQSVNMLVENSQNPLIIEAYQTINLDNQSLVEIEIQKLYIDSFQYENQTYYISVDRFHEEGIEWNIYTLLKEDDFMKNSRRAIMFASSIIMVVSILFVISMFFITKKITEPIVRLKESAKKLSQGIYSKVPVSKGNHELNQLAESFNEMGETISNLLNHLEEEVRIRTLELEEKNKILEHLTYIDALSQIANRRKFNEFFTELMENQESEDNMIGLIMMDIDYFKKYNDLYGHLEGDVCIQRLGEILKQEVSSSSDLVSRYGGEEFISVIRYQSYEAVLRIAEQIKLAVEDLNMLHEGSNHGYVSLSFGVLFVEDRTKFKAEELLKIVDASLYEAKEQGRNCIVSRQI